MTLNVWITLVKPTATSDFMKLTKLLSFLYYIKPCKSKATGLLPSLWESVLNIFLNYCRVYLICHLKRGLFSMSGKAIELLHFNRMKENVRIWITSCGPILIIPVVAVISCILVHLKDGKLLSSHQSGFASAHSTVITFLEAADSWLRQR